MGGLAEADEDAVGEALVGCASISMSSSRMKRDLQTLG